MNTEPVPKEILALERPHPALWTYYILCSILTGPGLLVTLPYLFFRYHTLRYRFDAEGIHMKVGLLFRREVNLTYARIQDIHLRSGILQRWLGVANLQVQTASGSAGPEMLIEGFKEYEAIRDFLYTRMRGYREHPAAMTARSGNADDALPAAAGGQAVSSGSVPASNQQSELVALLLGIRDELRRTREALEAGRTGRTTPPSPPHV